MATLAGSAYVEVKYDSSSIQAGRAQIAAEGRKAGQSFASSFARSGPALTRVGHTLTRSLTLPIGLAGAAATKYAYDFSQSLNHISALVGVGSKQMDQYRGAILKLSPAVGQGPKQLADALYFITSSGYKGAAALKVLEASAKGAASGLGDTKTIADLVTSAVTVYGGKNLSAAHAVDILTQAVRDGKGEPAQYATAMGRLIPVANNLGVSFDQASASVAALTLAGFSVDKAVTGMQSVFTNLSKPTKSGAAALDKVGLSYAGLQREIKDKGLLPAMLDLNKAFDGNGVALRQVFSNGKAIVPFLALTGQAAGRTSKVFGDLANSTGAANKAFETQSKTTAFQVQKAMAQIQVGAVSLGSVLLPIFAKLIGVVANAAQAFATLPQGMQEVAIGGAAVAFALGPVLTAIGNVVKAATAMHIALVGSETGFKGLIPSVAGMGPVGITVAAAITGIGLAFLATRGNTDAMTSAMNNAADAADTLGGALKKLKSSNLDVKQSELDRTRASEQLTHDQKALTKAIQDGGKHTARAHQLNEQVLQDTINLDRAQGAHTDALARNAQVQQRATKATRSQLNAIAGLGDATRSEALAALHAQRIGSRNVDLTTLQSKEVQILIDHTTRFAGSQEQLAAKFRVTNPALSLAHARSAELALAAQDLAVKIGHIPTKHQIQVYYKNNIQALISQAGQLRDSILQIPQSRSINLIETIRTANARGYQTGHGHAAGGPVTAGVTYPVGERGMELFTPSTNGTIIPNDKIHGGGWGSEPMAFNFYLDGKLIDVRVEAANRQTARRVKAGRKWEA